MKTKVCSRCKIKKSINSFYKNKRYKDGLYCYCKKCEINRRTKYDKNNKEKIKQYRKTYWNKNKDIRWVKSIKHLYGITKNDYNKLYNRQNGCCAICDIHQSELKERLSVDHNHVTKEVRGLLCNLCNKGLGFFRADNDNKLLKRAIKYLK